MENTTLGRRIAALRKQQNLTQDELAEKLGLSSQAVSKWENELSCPDIMLLPELARILHVTVDALLSGTPAPETRMTLPAEVKSPQERILRILVDSAGGDRVRVNLPVPLIMLGLEMGQGPASFQINGSKALEQIDFSKMLELIDRGVVGKLVEIDSEGDHVEIWVE